MAELTTIDLPKIIEALLFAAETPLNVEQIQSLFVEAPPSRDEILNAIEALKADYRTRSIDLIAVAGGYRFRVRPDYAHWVAQLWETRPRKYSRALLETLALIAYRQPITRAEIEAIRGVTVSTQIMRTLQDREWIKVSGYREVPGRPALFVTTPSFLEYFNLNSLEDLPPLAELDSLSAQLSEPATE